MKIKELYYKLEYQTLLEFCVHFKLADMLPDYEFRKIKMSLSVKVPYEYISYLAEVLSMNTSSKDVRLSDILLGLLCLSEIG